MKIRSCFVSNSSSSSFILSVPNYMNYKGEEQINLDCYSPIDDDDDFDYSEIKQEYIKTAKDTNSYIFDVKIDWENDSPYSAIKKLLEKLPNAKLIDEVE